MREWCCVTLRNGWGKVHKSEWVKRHVIHIRNPRVCVPVDEIKTSLRQQSPMAVGKYEEFLGMCLAVASEGFHPSEISRNECHDDA